MADLATNRQARGFLVHAWVKSGQVRLAGRLEGGSSFAIVMPAGASAILVAATDRDQAEKILNSQGYLIAEEAQHDDSFAYPRQTFDAIPLEALLLARGGWREAAAALSRAGIRVHGEAPRPAEDLLGAKGIRGLLSIAGPSRSGRRVGQFWDSPLIRATTGPVIALHWLALDIETSREGQVRAISLVCDASRPAVAEVLFRGPPCDDPAVSSFASEAGLLRAFLERIQVIDPDVLTGWNVIDFDLVVLCGRCAALGIPFLLGRSDEPARIETREGLRTRSFIPGRQAVDAMQLVRGSGTRFEDQTLDTVAANLLGTGKTVHARGEDKLRELDRLYRAEPLAFCRYCLEDSRLVIRILEKTGLHSLTQNRAALTGVGLDLAWTSIPTFERIYALELQRRRILPPPKNDGQRVSGASGGMVLDPKAGLFSWVLVFDFRSLYPSIMRTFGIDPLAHELARRMPRADDIVAPNGARFRRGAGILASLVTSYFEERSLAQARGDETGAYVYKILMNSFYGVLGSPGCRYGRTELAGAITSFGRMWLEFSRDWFESAGYRVLYGDTDSVFVETAVPAAAPPPIGDLIALGQRLADELNQAITRTIRERHELESALAIRSEKVYGRFLIPRMRNAVRNSDGNEADRERGRAKGYAGLLLAADGTTGLEVKGMEAARSDWTALARRFQMELLAMVFADRPAGEIRAYLDGLAADLRAGRLDAELVYKKQLRRNASAYGHSETPPVRAARLLGWTDRRGSIEYLMTSAGAEPLERIEHPIDYEHYVDHQLLPIWDSIADAAGLAGSGRFSRQAEFDW